MDLSVERLQAVLPARAMQFYPQTASTNDLAREWLLDGAARPGSVGIADEQTKGRGRLGRGWDAPPGTALMLSYLLRPEVDELSFVGMMGALAVVETAEGMGAHAAIKWPNDVQIDGRKLCGVLPEAEWQGDHLRGVVLGIGLNVRVDFSGTPFADTAISLESVIGAVDRVDVLTRLLERLDYWSARLASDDLFEAWRGRLGMLQRMVSVVGANGRLTGVAEAVDRRGALLVRDDQGVLHRVIAGDIALGEGEV